MTDLSREDVRRMSELSSGVAMDVTQPSCADCDDDDDDDDDGDGDIDARVLEREDVSHAMSV